MVQGLQSGGGKQQGCTKKPCCEGPGNGDLTWPSMMQLPSGVWEPEELPKSPPPARGSVIPREARKVKATTFSALRDYVKERP